MKNEETINYLKRYDSDLLIYKEAINLLDYFSFDLINEEIDRRQKEYQLMRSHKAPGPNPMLTIVYQALTKVLLKYCIIRKDKLYILNDGAWILVSFQNIINHFCKLINHAVSRYINANQFTKLNKMIMTDINEITPNTIIQFNDCYIDNNQFKKGQYIYGIPEYKINHDVYDLIEDPDKEVKLTNEVDDLIMHLLNNDKSTYNRFVDDLSMCLSNSKDFNRSHGKMIRLYGPTAQNGKSTLLELLSRSLNESNVISFNVAELNDYSLELITQNLVAFDPEEQENYWNLKISRSIKSIVTSEDILVRQIYSKPVQITPIATLISATNMLPKTEDKSDGLDRRMDWFYVKNKLNRPKEWFNQLYSKESLESFIRLLVKNFIKLNQTNELSELSEDMKNTLMLFRENNNSILAFINITDINLIKNRRTEFVYEQYEDYCNDNELTIMGKQKFNKEIEIRLNLIRKNKRICDLNQDDKDIIVYNEVEINPKKQYKSWV